MAEAKEAPARVQHEAQERPIVGMWYPDLGKILGPRNAPFGSTKKLIFTYFGQVGLIFKHFPVHKCFWIRI